MAYERTNTWENMNLKDLGGFIESKFKEMEGMASSADGLKAMSKDEVTDFQTRNAELTDARKRYQDLRDVDEQFAKAKEEMKAFNTADPKAPFASGGGGAPQNFPSGSAVNPEASFKSLGQLFVESAPYTKSPKNGLNNHGNIISDLEGVSIKSHQDAIKTTMTTSAGWAPRPPASFVPVLTALQNPVVADLIPQDETSEASILWYEETTFTNNAAAVAEGAAKPEAALALTLRTQPIVKLAVMLPITDEQLADVPQVRAYVDQRLTLMIRRVEDSALLHGDGVAPNLLGFHEKSGVIAIARGAGEDNTDAILRAITAVNSTTGFANASGVVLNPLQWQSIRLLRTTTGEYIWGHPALVGPATVWGLPVVATASETAGQGLVGDFQMYSHISRRLGIQITVGYINDDFQKNIQRIRLEERLSLEIYRAAAFAEITNMN